MKSFKSNPLYFAVLMALSSMPMNSHAGQSGTSNEAGEETLPEVNVSAPEIDQEQGYNPPKASSSKFTAPLLDTPKSVTVLPESLIKDTGSVTLQDALRNVPGITFGSAEGGGSIGDRPFIRGFDSQASMYVDGIRDVGGQSREIFALESVEVIKGPSGAYDGRGSAGGSINLVTKQPKAVNFVSGSVGLGTDRFKRATIDGNYMLADEVAVRVNAMAHKADTPGRDEVEVERFGLAPSITFGLTTPTSVNLSYYHLNTDDVPDYGLPYTYTGAVGTGITAATPGSAAGNRLLTGDRPVSVDKDNFYGLLDRDFRETSSDIGTATIKHAFNDDTVLRNTTRYGVTINDYIVTVPDDSKGNVQNGNVYRASKNRNTRTETIANVTDLSFKFDTGQLKHSVNTGIEFSHEESVNRPYVVTSLAGGTTCNAALFANNDCTSLNNPNPHDDWNGSISKNPLHDTTRVITKSAFAFDSIELSKKWLLNLGLRFDDYRAELDKETFTGSNPAGSFKNEKSFWNYQAGLVYKLQPNASIYASYGTSSSPSSVSGGNASDNLNANIENLEPERSKSYELGTKWDVMENLSLTAAVFKIEKTNARVTLADDTVDVVGNQEVKGFELGAAGRVTKKWQLFAGYTYLDSELVDNGDDPDQIANNGNRFPNTPRNSASLWTTYDILPKLTVGGGAFYVDKQYGNTANSVSIPSYVRFDAMAGYQIDKHLSLQLNIQNLTDKRYFDAAYSSHYAQVAAGRLSYLTLNFTY